MKTNVFLGIGLRIIALFTIAMLGTFLPETLNRNHPHFFNDHDGYFGARHIWFNIMMTLLFILSAINVIVGIIKVIQKNYDTAKW